MAIMKRKIDGHALLPTRNVRQRLDGEKLKSEPKVTPILRRRKRYSPCTPPLRSLPTNAVSDNSCSTPQDDEDSPSKVSTVAPTQSTARIRFKNTVSVIHIPSRTQYPDEMKKTLWGNLEEIASNASRNTIEFAFENFDWRAAIECEDMHVTETGERIHPVHARRTFKITPSQCAKEGQDHTGAVIEADPVDARTFSDTWFES